MSERTGFSYSAAALERLGVGVDMVLNGPVRPEDRENCFVLILWPFSSPAIGTYLSNGERGAMIEVLEETLAQMKAET